MKVVMYSTGCPNCKSLKRMLDNAGISYEVNESIDEMRELGITSVPVLFVDGERYNFSKALSWARSQKQ